jgi:RNA polymerase sigma-70 factor (ECF subfamily)
LRQILSSGAEAQRSEVTRLLLAWREGDAAALDQLVPLVEAELRRLAHHYLQRERPGHVLQTTALVNEAFVRLVSWRDVSLQNRSHFLAMSARMMRQILVDMSRRQPRGIHGGVIQFVDLADAERTSADSLCDVAAIHEALNDLAERDPRKAQIVELRFFGGLTLDEIAEVIGVAPVTVSREWTKARAWLRREMMTTGERAVRRGDDQPR